MLDNITETNVNAEYNLQIYTIESVGIVYDTSHIFYSNSLCIVIINYFI